MSAFSIVFSAAVRDDSYLSTTEETHYRITVDATDYDDAKAKFLAAFTSLPGVIDAASEG